MYNVYHILQYLYTCIPIRGSRAYILLYDIHIYYIARGVCRDFFSEDGKKDGTLTERLKNSLKIENVDMPCFENNSSNDMCA